MTEGFAEIVFEVEPTPPPSQDSPLPGWVCGRCFSFIRHNPVLHLSFCPIHGFAFELRPIRPTGYARAHGLSR